MGGSVVSVAVGTVVVIAEIFVKDSAATTVGAIVIIVVGEFVRLPVNTFFGAFRVNPVPNPAPPPATTIPANAIFIIKGGGRENLLWGDCTSVVGSMM